MKTGKEHLNAILDGYSSSIDRYEKQLQTLRENIKIAKISLEKNSISSTFGNLEKHTSADNIASMLLSDVASAVYYADLADQCRHIDTAMNFLLGKYET